MDAFEGLRAIIDTYIKENGAEEISGKILNNVLHTMLDDIMTAIAANKSSGGNADIPARLTDLQDVEITDPQDGEALVRDNELRLWVNKMIAGGGGDAKTEQDIVSEVKVGLLNVGDTIQKDTSFTDFLVRLLTASIGKALPTVTLAGLPDIHEVGSKVMLSPTYTYHDGKFTNTLDNDVPAGCVPGDATISLNGAGIELPYEYETGAAMVNKVLVTVPYEASTAQVKTKAGEDADVSIPAGIAKAEGKFITAYKWFIGGLTKSQVADLNSSMIRNFSMSGFITPEQSDVTIVNKDFKTEDGKWIVIAVPQDYELKVVNEAMFGINFYDDFVAKELDMPCQGSHTAKYKAFLKELSPSAGGVGINEIIISKV